MMVSGRILSPHIADASVENKTPLEDWERMYIPVRTICLLLCILGIIGNGMLIYLLSCRINKTCFTMYVLNISIADFLLIINYFIDNIFFFKAIQFLYLIAPLQYITYLLGNDASNYFLTVITFERYLLVFSPVWYHSHRPKHFTAFMCIIFWVLSLVITFLEYFSCHPNYFFITHLNCDMVISLHLICNFMNFISVVLLFTLALLTIIHTRSPRNLPARFDISIMASIVWTLVFWVPIRIVDFLHLWVPHEYLPDHFGVSLISEAIYSSGRPYIYLLVGWWKNQEQQRSIHIFIESALKHTEENMSTATEQDEEQA
ncbi:mas-related G-protein coupled receptor member X1-like [Paroedura picta]|uniref:mas-related G-protein coupled receptor member X1-like n=1 Tax=Paroedura picta TaxID=143630 RepID=UPI00405609D7